MSDTQPLQAMGGDGKKGAPDGVGQPVNQGRHGASETDGGAYPNPHTGKEPQSGVMGHGGQTDIEYRGSHDSADGDDNENAATGA